MPELGVGHGRDALYFAREGFAVHATALSPAGLDQRRAAACAGRVEERVTTTAHDVREPLPLPDASVDAVFAHMLLWMALSTQELHNLVGEARRVRRPGGTFVCTVRHTGDASYGPGTGHAATSVSTEASRCTSSPATWSTLSPTTGSWERRTPSRRAACLEAVARHPDPAPSAAAPTPAPSLIIAGTGLLCVTLLPAGCHRNGHTRHSPAPSDTGRPEYALHPAAPVA
ncbi:class I SAM-dependent methyltransferase [Streptomyces sp. NPDC051771]|uniref:class I SAM-dependent methyltransferase n=1 Tax=Streptomyces sp. NPDC051771 TaxID=3154847 RepID=UPI003414EA16